MIRLDGKVNGIMLETADQATVLHEVLWGPPFSEEPSNCI